MPVDELAAQLQSGAADPPISDQQTETEVTQGDDAVYESTGDEAVGGESESGESQAAESQSPALREIVRSKYGLDVSKYHSDDDMIAGLVNAARRIGERDQDSQVGRLLRDNPAVVIDHLRQTYPDAFGQPQQQVTQKQQDDIPEWDDAWLHQVERNEKGDLIAKPGADPSLPVKINKRAKWEEKQAREWAINGEKRAREIAREEAINAARAISQETVQSSLAQHSQAAQAAGWFESQRSWLFNNGEMRQGNLSPAGMAFANLISEADSIGIKDMNQQLSYAMRLMPKPAAGTKPQTRQATRQPPTAGTTPGRGEGRRKGEDPVVYGLRLLKQLGIKD